MLHILHQPNTPSQLNHKEDVVSDILLDYLSSVETTILRICGRFSSTVEVDSEFSNSNPGHQYLLAASVGTRQKKSLNVAKLYSQPMRGKPNGLGKELFPTTAPPQGEILVL